MAITQTVNASEFTSAFHRMGRGDQFSHDALLALYDYLSDLSDDIGEPIELDVIGLCCDWNEIDIEDIQLVTGCHNLDELLNNTHVIDLGDGTILYQSF